MMPLELGIVILTHGVRTDYRRLVEQLLDEGFAETSMVVVHNPVGSGRLAADPASGRVPIIECAVNRGYAGGMNCGIARFLEAGAPMLVLLTGEVQLHRRAMAQLMLAARRAPEYGILGPALRWLGQDRMWSYGGTRNRWGATDQLRDHAPVANGEGIATCQWVDGSAMLIRADVFRDVGLLDERFFLYFEETEFCLRAERSGWRVGVVLDAVGEQAPGDDQRPGGYSYLLTRNGLEYSRIVAGRRGIAVAIGRSMRESVRMARIVAGRHAPATARRRALTKLIATWLGVAAFAGRRWGPPPRIVPGLGDIIRTAAT